MRESVLHDFFVGNVDDDVLNNDLSGSSQRTTANKVDVQIEDEEGEFEVLPEHLVRVCDAALLGRLDVDNLATIGFCLAASDYFTWDTDSEGGRRVAETVFDWSAPEINFALTLENIDKFKTRLLTGVDKLRA